MKYYGLLQSCLLLCATPAMAQVPEPTDSVQIETQVVRILREAHEGGAIQVVPNARAMLERYAVCRGEGFGANCRLAGDEPVYVIWGAQVTGDSATVRVTTYRDTSSHGLYSVTETWVLQRRSRERWEKIGIRESETIWSP